MTAQRGRQSGRKAGREAGPKTGPKTGRALLADIGGTNARFALSGARGARVAVERRFAVAEFASLTAAARAFLDAAGAAPEIAVLAVAAPVSGGDIAFTNSPWRLRPAELAAALGLKTVRVVNDFEALAAGLDHLEADEFAPLVEAPGVAGAPRLALGPGTGFGQALIIGEGRLARIVSTQGGHVAFAPQDAREAALHAALAAAYGRVSIERVLSGAGLEAVGRVVDPGSRLSAPEIVARAGADPKSRAAETVAAFLGALGAAVGDAVLSTGARGGVTLAGGVAKALAPFFPASPFRARYLAKGRMRDYVAAAPVRLLLSDRAALIGAARIAMAL